jgi:hypothetical protein
VRLVWVIRAVGISRDKGAYQMCWLNIDDWLDSALRVCHE